MRVCVRCNPVSVLLSAPDGEYCYLHGTDYIAEDRDEPQIVVEPEVDATPMPEGM